MSVKLDLRSLRTRTQIHAEWLMVWIGCFQELPIQARTFMDLWPPC